MKIRMEHEAAHAQHLRWQLQFLSKNLGFLDREAKDVLRVEYFTFIRDCSLGASDLEPVRIDNPPGPLNEFLEACTDDVLEQFRKESGPVLDKLVDNKLFIVQLGAGRFRDPHIMTISQAGLSRFQQSVQFESDIVAKGLLALTLHVVYSGLTGERLRRCPICGTIFIRNQRKPQAGREAYCGPTCKRTAATRTYLERKSALAKGEAQRTETRTSDQPATKGRRAPAKKRNPKRG